MSWSPWQLGHHCNRACDGLWFESLHCAGLDYNKNGKAPINRGPSYSEYTHRIGVFLNTTTEKPTNPPFTCLQALKFRDFKGFANNRYCVKRSKTITLKYQKLKKLKDLRGICLFKQSELVFIK